MTSDIELIVNSLFEQWFEGKSDFTLLLPDELLKSIAAKEDLPDSWWYQYCCEKMGRKATPERWTSFEFEVSLFKDETTARLQVSRAFNRWAWSLTVRWRPPNQTERRVKG